MKPACRFVLPPSSSWLIFDVIVVFVGVSCNIVCVEALGQWSFGVFELVELAVLLYLHARVNLFQSPLTELLQTPEP